MGRPLLLYRVTILEVAKFYMPQIKRQSNVFSICLIAHLSMIDNAKKRKKMEQNSFVALLFYPYFIIRYRIYTDYL